MKKLILKLGEKIRQYILYDKTLHFIAGELISFVASLILFALKAPFPLAIVLALVITFLVGTFKEYCIDARWKNENPEFGDIVATLLGGSWIALIQVVMFSIMDWITVY